MHVVCLGLFPNGRRAILSQKYGGETRDILADFLLAMEKRGDVDPYFLAELKQLTETRSLGYSSEVKARYCSGCGLQT